MMSGQTIHDAQRDDSPATLVTGLSRMRRPRTSAEPSTRIGWDPWEPGALAIGLILVLIAGALPWWGFAMDTSQIPYVGSAGTDFGVWGAEEWQVAILPGAVFREATLVWWEFVRVHPEFADYGTVALVTSTLWTSSLLAGGIALRFRFKPRSRLRGWPTVLEGIAAGVLALGIAIAAAGFPMAADLSFAGTAGRLTWGPKLGWFATVAAFGLFSLSSVLGWRSDRSLRGLCWKCYQKVSSTVCEYCEATQ